MVIPAESQNLIQKMLSGGVESVSAYQEYCLKRCQADQPQVKIDNSFLNYLSTQSTIDQCSWDVLYLAATIYRQHDGYAKPPKFIELLEQSSSLPLPAVHRAYLVLASGTQKENILKNIKEQSQTLAEQNTAAAQFNLGIMYEDGRGIPPEEMLNKDAMAVEWYRKAAQGDAAAQCNLGIMYAKGRGILPEELPRKDAIAVEWYRKAAAQEDARAQCNLGNMYANGRGILPEEIPKKDVIAVELYRKAAAQGDAAAQCNLGNMYAKGRGIPPEELPKKDAIAIEWYRKAAAQGHSTAQGNLGIIYEKGREISPKEMLNKDTIAVEWYRKAAAQGDARAQCNLGNMYANGLGISPEEIPKKDAMAVEWFRKAAAQGDAAAQCHLGVMYATGRGILENEKSDKVAIAYYWYSKSALRNDEAKAHLRTMVISPYQLKKANMMLVRHLDYQQVNYLFQERVFKSFLLLGLVIKNKNNGSSNPKFMERLPSDLLFKIAEQLAPFSTDDIQDIYNKFIPTLSKELTFKAKYLAANNSIALFFKSNPIAEKVKSGAPLLLDEVEKYAKEYPNSVEAQVYNQLKN